MKMLIIPTLLLAIFAFAASGQDTQALDQAFTQAHVYVIGSDGAPLETISAEVRRVQLDPPARATLAVRLAQLAADTNASYEGRAFACRQLYIIGTEAEVPVIAPLLRDEKFSDMARYALEKIPGTKATQAFLDALASTNGRIKIGIINSLGQRGDALATGPLSALLQHPDPAVLDAVYYALGALGSEEAVEVLAAAPVPEDSRLKNRLHDAQLACADRYLRIGKKDQAASLYRTLHEQDTSPQVRLAALRGLLRVEDPLALDLAIEHLASRDPARVRPVVGLVATMPGSAATQALLLTALQSPPEQRAEVLLALAERGDPSVLTEIAGDLSHESPEVRRATLVALGKLGHSFYATTLAEHAAQATDPQEQTLAREALVALRGEGVDTAMLDALIKVPDHVRLELVQALGERGAPGAAPVLITLAETDDAALRERAAKAAAATAGPDDVPALVRLVLGAKDADARGPAQSALLDAVRRLGRSASQVPAMLEGLRLAEGTEARVALLEVLGDLGDAEGLPALHVAAREGGEAEMQAAIAALANWPTPKPREELWHLAQHAGSDPLKSLALDGYIRVLRMPDERPVEEIVADMESAMGAAQNVEQKRAVLAGLSEIAGPLALAAIQSHAGDPDIGPDARLAAERIHSATYSATASKNGEQAKQAFDNNPNSRWDSGDFQQPGQWFQLDLGREARVKGITIDTMRSREDYPRGYEVYVFTDPNTPGDAVAKGEATQPVTEITWPAASGRYIKIVQTGEVAGKHWSIHELKVIPE